MVPIVHASPEYRYGGRHSYGAFTYVLSQVLRDDKRQPIKTTKQLSELINSPLPALGYEQHCAIDGPKQQLDLVGNWLGRGE